MYSEDGKFLFFVFIQLAFCFLTRLESETTQEKVISESTGGIIIKNLSFNKIKSCSLFFDSFVTL